MNRPAIAVLALIALAAAAVPPAALANGNDFKVIQNAVKNSPSAERGHEPLWFKVLIQDGRTGQGSLKITLPVALVELVLDSAEGRHFKVDECHAEIDVKAVWTALKKAGPRALVEIRGDDGAVLKIWLE